MKIISHFLFSILIFTFSLVFLADHSYAQGTCTCRTAYPDCLVDNDSCDDGYVAVCPGIYSCSPTACVCELENPGVNCAELGDGCSFRPPPCCETLGLTCYMSYCLSGVPTPTPTDAPAPTAAPITPFSPSLCNSDPCEPGDFDYPWCMGLPPDGIQTGLGCISFHPLSFVANIRDILIGIGSGIAILMMIVGAFFVLTSQGQPEKIARGKEIFIGGAVGLLIMIFAVFLLRLIGVDILGILEPL